MKKSIVFSSATGNTKKLGETFYNTLGEEIYCGKISDEALDADVIFVGSWTMAFNCAPDVKAFLEKLNGKKEFMFMTAGYGSTPEFFAPIINAAKENINASNEIIGEFICQGKVSASKQDAIKKMDLTKFESMKPELDNSQTHPDNNDIAKLVQVIKALNI